jgi:hypothetical protein
MATAAGDCVCPAYIFYDPFEEHDRRQFEMISSTLTVAEIKLPFAGHATSVLFDTPSRLGEILGACQRGDVARLVQFGAKGRRRNRDRPYLMAMWLAARRPAVSIQIAEKHGAGWTAGQQAKLCFRLAVGGVAKGAVQWVAGLAAEYPDDEEIQGCAAIVACKAGEFDLAHRFVDRARHLNPDRDKWFSVQSSIRKQQLGTM